MNQRFVIPVCGHCNLPLVSREVVGFGCTCRMVGKTKDYWLEVQTIPAPIVGGVDDLRALLEDVHHTLTTLHGLVVADGAAPQETWGLDLSYLLGQIDASLAPAEVLNEETP